MPDAESMQPAIDALRIKLREQEGAVQRTKQMINELSELAGMQRPYPNADTETTAAGGTITADAFYGKALSTAAREYLETRKLAGLGPAAIGEIFAALKKGGYRFETKDDDNAKRGLRESLTKNTSIFHRLPTGEYGLRIWYPAVKEPKPEVAARRRGRPKKTRPGRAAKPVESPLEVATDLALNLIREANIPMTLDAIIHTLHARGMSVNKLPLSGRLGKLIKRGIIARVGTNAYAAVPSGATSTPIAIQDMRPTTH